MLSSGVLIPTGPQKCVRCSGSIMQRNTSSRGASKMRTIVSSPVSVRVGHGRVLFLVVRRLVVGLEVAQVLLELVEPLGPDPTVALDPVDGAVEGARLEPARAELRLPARGR